MVTIKENKKHEEKTIVELRKVISEKIKEIERLEKKVKDTKLKLLKMGVKKEILEKLDKKPLDKQQQENNKSEQLVNKRDFDIKPIHPGEILREELLIPRNISPEELAKEIKVSKEIVKWVCQEREGITLDLAERLSVYFDTSVELWLNLQRSYEKDLSEANANLDLLRKEIIPYKEKHANGKYLRAN